jgi:hypothetical protein
VNCNLHIKDTKIMKTTLNLTTAAVALVLFATSTAMLTPANAADRQITVNPKNFPTFTVNKDVEQAATEPRDTPVKIKRTKEDSFRFRIEDKTQQAAAPPSLDEEEQDIATPDDRPAKLLNEQAKLIKKPAPAETDESDNAADIAEDQPEADSEAVADSNEDAATPEVRKTRHRTYYYASKQKSFEQSHQEDDSTETVYNDDQQSEVPTYYDYTGASCNHSYNGY